MFVMPAGAENYAKVTDDYFLGTDHLGRNLWARTSTGPRLSGCGLHGLGRKPLVGTI